MKQQVFSLLVALLFMSCSQTLIEDNSDVVYIDFSSTKSVPFTDYFSPDSCNLVQFEMNDSVILGNDLYVKYLSGYYFVYDRTTQQFLRFDRSGKFLNFIGVPGLAPQEHTGVSDFQCDSINHIVHVLCSTGNEIKKFAFTGGYIETIKMPFNVLSFALVADDSYWLYAGFYHPDHYRVHRYHNQEVTKSYLFLRTKHFGVTDINFTGSSVGLFKEIPFPTIYQYGGDSLFPIVKFNFGEYEQTEQDFEKISDPFEFMDNSNQNGFCSILDAFYNANFYVVNTTFQKNNEPNLSYFVIDRSTKSVVKLVPEANTKELIDNFRFIGIDEENICYFMVVPMILDSYRAKHNNDFKPDYNKSGNPIIIKFKIL